MAAAPVVSRLPNQTQTIRVAPPLPTGGQYKISFSGITTALLAHSELPNDIQLALEAAGIPAGSITVA